MATKRNLEFALTETWLVELACVDPDGNPLDITNGGVEFRLASATALLLDMRLAAEGSGFTGGLATMVIAPADQAAVTPGLYSYETRCFLSNGRVFDQLYGSLNARQSLFRQFPYSGPANAEPGQLDFSDAAQSGLIGH